VLDEKAPDAPADMPTPTWLGTYIEPETGLSVRITGKGRNVTLHYLNGPVELLQQPDGTAVEDGGGMRLRPTADGLWFDIPDDNQSTKLIPADGTPSTDAAGTYHSADLDAFLTIADSGGVLYGACTGVLGDGRMELLQPIGADLWAMPCPRGVDHFPPGDWTLAVQRDGKRITGIRVGCWLARQFLYTPVK